ncbi:MAG: lysophospholipid acyltransferase family protein [Deltaproteobacteria bacterium]|nr:lysophospholipid acyltransferase family protein [Deltaproteobacteria bacterium]
MKSKKILRWYDPILLTLMPPLAALLIKFLMSTCRVIKVIGQDRKNDIPCKSSERSIYVTWHQRMSYFFYLFGARNLTVMISRSRDGEYAARLAGWLGFKSVRGSSTRGGLSAFREMIKRLKNGESTGILADGPHGPARVVKKGAVVMARSLGIPINPIVWGADRCWVLNSWDRYLIPKPFARVVICYPKPVSVPSTARGEELEACRRLLEERLNESSRLCDLYFGRERPWHRARD